MLLEIEREVFDTEDEHGPVVGLLQMILQRRHVWRPAVGVADAAERWVAANLPTARAFAELIHQCLVEAANPPPAGVHPATVPAQRLPEVVNDLRSKARLVVEDEFTEECFLLAAAQAFGRTRIVEARQQRWLEFSHAGGKDRMPQFVTQRRRDFCVLVRVAAVMDSDRRIPRQQTPNHRYAERIRSQGIDLHVWCWRELENYVPRQVWELHFPDRDRKIGMLLAMRPDQRGHLDIKHGLQDQLETDSEVAKLFADLPEAVREEWRTGFARRRRGMPAPIVPDGLVLTEQDFAELGPDVVSELRSVLAMIERIL